MSEFDGPWKEALDHFFELFVAFFLPAIHADIDWSRDYEPQDQELQKLAPEGDLGVRRVDKLVKVFTLAGDAVLLHLEVQNQRDDDFARRLYVYNYRGEDRYNQPVVTVAILGDDAPSWRPTTYSAERWGCKKHFAFVTLKLLDRAERLEELETHRNPFALLVLAHLQAHRTHGNDDERVRWKLRLIRRLYERGLDGEDLRHFYRFFDWMLNLPQEMERAMWTELEREEKENRMPYITSVERIGMEKGLHQGVVKSLERFLGLKFGPEGAALGPRLKAEADVAVLHSVFDAAYAASSLDELQQAFPWLKAE